MNRRFLVLPVVIVLAAAMAPATRAGLEELRVNEIMALNGGTLLDEAGDSQDWVEIFNSGTTPVNLEGMFLTDTPLDTQRWSFPDTLIQPGGYLIVWCDNEELEGPLHANFSLNSDGEFIGLYEYLGIGNDVVDSTSFGRQARDVSFGRYPNGAGPYGFMPVPTPAADNAPHGNIPPFFEDTRSTPTVPDDDEPVTVVTTISDDTQIIEAKLFYDAGSGFIDSELFDDGGHGDGAAGDGTYGGAIPGFPADTQVRWYIWAQDDSLTAATDPDGAPGETFSYFVAYEPPAIYINELMAQNVGTIDDGFGEFEDWVEIYNRSDVEVNLAGMYLSDDPLDTNKWEFSDAPIPARGFLLIWCDDNPEQGPLHATFRLDADGEFIGLYDRDLYNRAPIDSLSFGGQTADISLGRFPNGIDDWRLYNPATPGESNVGSSVDEEQGRGGELRIFGVTSPIRETAILRYRAALDAAVRLQLFDAAGRRVLSTPGCSGGGGGELRIDARGLAAGLYLWRLEAGGRHGSGRLVIVR